MDVGRGLAVGVVAGEGDVDAVADAVAGVAEALGVESGVDGLGEPAVVAPPVIEEVAVPGDSAVGVAADGGVSRASVPRKASVATSAQPSPKRRYR